MKGAVFFRLAMILGLAVLARERPAAAEDRAPAVVIGSKGFPESWILGAALTALVQETGTGSATHKKNLGGTEITYQALKAGSIDVYPEYTGTIAEVILKTNRARSPAEMRTALGEAGIAVSDPLGFNDGYAIAVTKSTAERLGVASISDLKAHPELHLGFTHEFLGRGDGFPGLSRHYGLAMRDVRGVQHELAYEALARGQIDAMDIYTTDPQIEKMALVLLRDDLAFFPRYDAVLLYRADLGARAPAALQAMTRVVGRIDEKIMMHANAAVALHGVSAEEGARQLLSDALGDQGRARAPGTGDGQGLVPRVLRNVGRHLELVGISLFFAVLVGLPLGIWATRSKPVALLSLGGAGLLQTIPSMALLAFLIPLLGIGTAPALVALFVYGLLPIVQSTYTGLTSIPSALSEAADAIGLRPGTKLRRVALPMASPTILSGIKTSAVINVGTATLAALIGAEGLGNAILQGIALRDTGLILEGSVPAALLALLVQGAFSWLDSLLIPEGLRLSSRAP
ncbi:MAG TPA: glycine betaine ABC transporter substrate-binding protein [Polyangiaceae bacterium]|nr:glycine betaine ABC transporter substrate-binding protein [Polyangiaceae bacterium]